MEGTIADASRLVRTGGDSTGHDGCRCEQSAVAGEWWTFGAPLEGLSRAALILPGRAGAWPLPTHFPNSGSVC